MNYFVQLFLLDISQTIAEGQNELNCIYSVEIRVAMARANGRMNAKGHCWFSAQWTGDWEICRWTDKEECQMEKVNSTI